MNAALTELWTTRSLADCGQFLSGGTPNRSIAEYWGGSIPWISAKSLKTFRVSDSEERVTESGAENGTRMVPPGTLLFVVRGMSLAKEFRVAVTTGPVAFNQDLRALVPSSDVDPVYLTHFLRASEEKILGLVDHASHGTTRLTSDRMDAFEIPIPPIAEQRRIAEVLDLAEALRAKRRGTLAQLDTLTQSIFLDLFGDPARNERDWPATSLADIGDWQSGGTPVRTRGEFYQGSIPWFSSGELNEMFVRDSNEHISEDAILSSSAKKVPTGALMLGMYDTAALKASIAGVDCACNQAIAFGKLDARIAENIFVYFCIVIGREHFRRLQRGVRQKNLNLSMIRDLQIPLPPLALQQDFARRIAAVEKLKGAQRASLAELDALFASLQHRAFRGEL